MPFARKRIQVVGYDIDKTALYGGPKFFPINRISHDRKKYTPGFEKPVFPELETEQKSIMGLQRRLHLENLTEYVAIREQDFYRSETKEVFDLVFTSCSLQYKCNRDMGLIYMLDKLKMPVKVGGYLYMDYMMPLEDSHLWKSELFLRGGQISNYFDEKWQVEYCREQTTPILEFAHVDRPADHYHRFGYILAKRLKDD